MHRKWITQRSSKMKDMYKRIKEEIQEGQYSWKRIVIIGDFNCKVGERIKDGYVEITKGRKIMLEMMKEYNLELVNTWEHSKGKWTREEAGK